MGLDPDLVIAGEDLDVFREVFDDVLGLDFGVFQLLTAMVEVAQKVFKGDVFGRHIFHVGFEVEQLLLYIV